MIQLLVSIVVVLIVFGVAIWAVSLIPMPAPFKQIAMAAIGLILLLVILGMVGIIPGAPVVWRVR